MVVVYVWKEGDTIFLLIGSPRVCDHRLHLINRQQSASGAGCVRFKVGFIRPQPSSVWEILTIRSAALERPMLDFSAIFPLLFYFDLFFLDYISNFVGICTAVTSLCVTAEAQTVRSGCVDQQIF